MSIREVENPVDGSMLVLAEGKVERIVIKEAEQTAKNIEYGVTHIASIVVGGQWINFISLGIREGKEPDITVNMGTKDKPDWKRIEEGDEVRVIVQRTVKGDKTYYNAKRSGIKLTKKGEGGGSSSGGNGGSGSSYTPKAPRDNTGMSVGHSLNGAMNFIMTRGVEPSDENITRYATSVHTVTERLKAGVAKARPELSDYDVGASVGNAVLNAAKLVGEDVDFETTLEAVASDLLNNVVTVIEKFVREGRGAAQAPKTTRAAPAKTASKPVNKAAKAEKPAPAESPADDEFDDDDTIPF